MADDDREDSRDVDPGPLDTFAKRLDYLFRRVHPRGQRPYSYEHVAESIRREQGIDISANYIWMLRSGRRDNPTLRHLEGLARFFGVSPAFLSDADEAERVRPQLDKLSDLASSGVQHVAMRGSPVDTGTLDAIHSLLDQVRQLADGLGRPHRPPSAHPSDEPTDPEP